MLRIGEECSGSGSAAISSCTRAAITSREDTSIHHLLFCQSSLSHSPFQQHPSTSSSEESSFTFTCFHILASPLCSPSSSLARNNGASHVRSNKTSHSRRHTGKQGLCISCEDKCGERHCFDQSTY